MNQPRLKKLAHVGIHILDHEIVLFDAVWPTSNHLDVRYMGHVLAGQGVFLPFRGDEGGVVDKDIQ